MAKHTPSERVRKQIERSFTYQTPQGDQQQRYVAIRNKLREAAELIAELTPESREQSLAITSLEESCMWANAAIARNETADQARPDAQS